MHRFREGIMEINLDDVDLAVVVNIEILREVLSKMSANGRTWWIACEPSYALERGHITIAYGCPGAVDRLNTVLYRVPILNTESPIGGTDKLLVLLDLTVIVAEQAGLYREGDRVIEDEFADIGEFFVPIQQAVVQVLAEHTGTQMPAQAQPASHSV
jgi:hypothetical protein